MKLAITLMLLVATSVLLSGCRTPALQAAIDAQGKSHHVKQFSGGVLVGEWDTLGEVETDTPSARFQDKKTNRLVELMGDIQITVNE